LQLIRLSEVRSSEVRLSPFSRLSEEGHLSLRGTLSSWDEHLYSSNLSIFPLLIAVSFLFPSSNLSSIMKSHWENIYNNKQLHEVSWYQPTPTTSLALIEMLNLPSDARIIDIGGGDSLLLDNLLQHGFTDISVLDISAKALERARRRVGEDSGSKVNWIEADISTYDPKTIYDLWHDRAVFHFLTEPKAVAHYVAISSAHIKKGGYLIVATFAEDGPFKCSGLPIQQYNEESLSAVFAENFETLRVFKEVHLTPTAKEQSFVFALMKRK